MPSEQSTICCSGRWTTAVEDDSCHVLNLKLPADEKKEIQQHKQPEGSRVQLWFKKLIGWIG